MRNIMYRFALCAMMVFGMSTMPVMAFGDDLGTTITQTPSGNTTNTTNNQTEYEIPIEKQPLDEGTESMSEFISTYQPVTPEQMSQGRAMAKPISKFIGNIITLGLALLTVWLFLQTVVDMAYILVPPLQPTLSGQVQVQGKVARCWVTTEALQACGSAQPQGARPMGYGGGMSGGMGRPMGYGGGMGMSGGMGRPMGMAGGGGGQPQRTSSNMLLSYFKSRVVTLIVFGICIILLFSNLFLGFGSILGEWIYTIFIYIGNMLS